MICNLKEHTSLITLINLLLKNYAVVVPQLSYLNHCNPMDTACWAPLSFIIAQG